MLLMISHGMFIVITNSNSSCRMSGLHIWFSSEPNSNAVHDLEDTCRWADSWGAADEQQWHGYRDHGLQDQLQDDWRRGRLLLLPGTHPQCSAGAADICCGAPHDGALLVPWPHEQQVSIPTSPPSSLLRPRTLTHICLIAEPDIRCRPEAAIMCHRTPRDGELLVPWPHEQHMRMQRIDMMRPITPVQAAISAPQLAPPG